MAMGSRAGPMEANTLGNMCKASRRAMVPTSGLTGANTLANGAKIKLMVSENTCGAMEGPMKENG